MQEVKSRVFCSGDGCKECLEYWATLSITMRDTSDTFQSSSTPEIEVSGPEMSEGWTSQGSWTRRYYCPVCSDKNREEEERRRSRKKKS